MDTKYPPKPQNAGDPPVDDPAVQRAVRAGHETRDVSVKGLFIFAGALFVSLAAIFLGLVILFKTYQYADRWLTARRSRTESGARSLVRARPDYRGPLLQVKPEEDLRWMRAHDGADLGGYAWVDRQKGVVRLPIDRAMELTAARGLPPVSPGLTLEAIQRQRADPQVYGQSLRP